MVITLIADAFPLARSLQSAIKVTTPFTGPLGLWAVAEQNMNVCNSLSHIHVNPNCYS